MKMSKKKPAAPFFGFLPAMQFKEGEENYDNAKEWRDELKSNMKTFWEQKIEMQKSSIEASKEQWNRYFGYLMDIEETFASSLPEKAPALPGCPAFPLSPKEFMNRVMEFQKMSNKHFIEQADSAVDFFFKGQDMIRDAVYAEAEEPAEEKKESAQADDEKSKPAKTTAAKDAAAKK